MNRHLNQTSSLAGGPSLLTVNEACRLVAVGRTTLYRLISNGKIRTVRIGPRGVRVPASELEHFVQEQLRPKRKSPPGSAPPLIN